MAWNIKDLTDKRSNDEMFLFLKLTSDGAKVRHCSSVKTSSGRGWD